MRTTEIIDLKKNIALKASAGSGKTFALSLRVVNMLLDGIKPDRILCITFTNKATREMYQRIIALIRYLAFELNPSHINDEARYLLLGRRGEDISGDISGCSFSREEVDMLSTRAIEVWREVVGSISRLGVQTIDSFLNTIVRMFPFEAGVMPDFTVLSSIASEGLLMEAFEDFVGTLEDDGSLKKLLGELIRKSGKAVNSPATFMHAYFERFLEMRTSIERLTAETLTCLEEGEGSECSESLLARLLNTGDMDIHIRIEARAFGNRLKQLCPEISKFGLSEIEKYFTLDAASFTGLTSIAKDSYEEYRYFSKCGNDKRAQELFARIKKELSLFIQAKNAVYRDALLYLFSLFMVHLDAIKERENGWTFSDITNVCHKLLAGGGIIEQEREYFYFRIDSRIDHLLIDEFQDTNYVQWLILKPVVDELTAGIGQREEQGSFFYVGDPKQSIYRFRGGESRLFDTVLEQYQGKIRSLTLDTNFRSARTVVAFVNEIFVGISDRHVFDYEVQKAKSVIEGYVEVAFFDAEEHKHDRDIKKDKVITWVRRIMDSGYNEEDIAILCATNKECEDYARHLYLHGIPAVTEGSMTILHSPAVDSIIELMKYLNDPVQHVYLLSFLFSVPGLLKEREREALLHVRADRAVPGTIKKRLLKIRSRAGLLPVVSIVRMIIDEFDLYERYDQDPNIGLLLDMTTNRTFDDPVSLRAFLHYAEDELSAVRASATEALHAVTISTVHKAKGLEFPCVIIPEIEITMSVSARETPLIYEYDEVLQIKNVHMNENRDALHFHTALERAVETERGLTVRDRLNQLYVALTRAQESLFVAAVINGDEDRDRDVNTMKVSDVLYDVIGSKGYVKGTLASSRKAVRSESRAPRKRRNCHEVLGFIAAYRKGTMTTDEDEKKYATASLENYQARRFGMAFHYAMEVLRSLQADAVGEATERVRAVYGAELSDDDIDAVMGRVKLLLENEKFRDLIQGRRVEREVTFLREKNVSVVDLMAIGNDRINVIDFKTSYDDDLISRYEQQIKRYCDLVTEAFGVPSKGYICFVLEDRIQYREV